MLQMSNHPRKPITAAMYFLMRALPVKPFIARQLEIPSRKNNALQPDKFSTDIKITTRRTADSHVITLWASAPKVRSDAHIVYLHGGGHALQAMPFHRRFAEHLARRTGSYVSLLDFPLPPEAQCTDILEAVRAIYRQLSGDYRQHRFILMGDSAGGGLALSLLQELKGSFAGETKNPDGTVLYSPWLDVGLLALEKDSYHTQKEAILPLAALRKSGARYAGDINMGDARCSPLYGTADGLGKLQIFISQDELFYPDSVQFYKKAAQARGTEIELIAEPHRLHCWPVCLPFYEQENNFQQMANFCKLPLSR